MPDDDNDTVPDLISEQERTAGKISRFITNYQRLGQAKMKTAGVTQSRIELVRKYWTDFSERHDAIENAATAVQRKELEYFTNEQYEITEVAYMEALGQLFDALDEVKPKPADAPAHPAGGSTAVTKLPKIELPTFSGDYLEWQNYKDLFTSAVRHHEGITAAQKLQYLKSTVSGDAASLIKNFAVTGANYDLAWETLNKRYSQERVLINAHLSALANLKLAAAGSGQELRRLLDRTKENIGALRNLGRPVDHWDDWLVFQTVQILGTEARKAWELSRGAQTTYPTWQQLEDFLLARAQALETIGSPSQPEREDTKAKPTRPVQTTQTKAHHIEAKGEGKAEVCPVCEKKHRLPFCPVFKKKSLEERKEYVRKNPRCFNCLRLGHLSAQCRSEKRCLRCQRKHHTLLHFEAANDGGGAPASTPEAIEGASTSTTVHLAQEQKMNEDTVLLATARVGLGTEDGRIVYVRALLDQGSQSSFVSESVAQQLRASRRPARVSVSGLGGQTHAVARYRVSLGLWTAKGDPTGIPFDAYVIRNITPYKPARSAVAKMDLVKGLDLADPDLSGTAKIDVLLGAKVYAAVLLSGVRSWGAGSLVAQRTRLGWIVSGSPETETTREVTHQVSLHCAECEELDDTLRRFWELEELPPTKRMSPEDQQCEEHFLRTHTRDAEGRYVLRLPLKKERPLPLGESLSHAMGMLRRTEPRLQRNPLHAAQYSAFLDEYVALGHMEEISETECRPAQVCYLPHHPVFRDSSVTTPLRVVFNASSPTRSGKSLNDCLLTGPTLLPDLREVVLRGRQHPIALTADVAKMYRQIRVHPDDADLQRIVWRPAAEGEIRHYRLLTLTYGTSAAPYQAIRTLRHLAEAEESRFPAAATTVKENFYMDDLFCGARNVGEARRLRDDLNALLASGGFPLRKWASNCPEVLEDVPTELLASSPVRNFAEDSSLKVLGIQWDPVQDVFRFNVTLMAAERVTKRTLLSAAARFFDPLGWAAPVLIVPKILIQEMWLQKLDWDDPAPPDITEKWNDYRTELPILGTLSMTRHIGESEATHGRELHGFADASNRAYAAVVYCRVYEDPGHARATLLLARTKVAPVKQVSIPKLELCAADLLARTMLFVQQTLRWESVPTFAWSDNTTVLAWIRGHSSRWPTFVANRVANIQTLLPKTQWRHVPTADNPADCASRGIPPRELVEHALWWRGPPWLEKHSAAWPQGSGPRPPADDLIQDTTVTQLGIGAAAEEPPGALEKLLLKQSNWARLLRITAYVLKFARNAKTPREQRRGAQLSAEDTIAARDIWVKCAQEACFAPEIELLKKDRKLPRGSPLLALSPFLDASGVLRLGGRLGLATQRTFSEKHPIILGRHRVTELIIDQVHQDSLHGGPQLMIQIIRQQFWILSCRNLAKMHVRRCLACIRNRAKTPTQIMADLPEERVTPAPPFTNTGVDYAGPIMVRTAPGRGHKAYKGYIALFVCFGTRAIHLELVSSYDTPGFLAAFNRFVARRGIPRHMYSDQGTNFVGASREMQENLHRVLTDPDLAARMAKDGTTWHFNPPGAPHFGGLWEAGVKSVKHHLRRVLGSHTLTFEEMYTLLTGVEACLNSRPLGPQSDDPQDLAPVTPGHFLTGASLKAVPEPSVLDVNVNRLSRWQLVRQLYEQVWKVWSADYLNSLQQRKKWREATPDLQQDELVLVRQETLPPCKWPLGRVIDTHPGADGKTRVVTVRTASTTYQRPISKICPLLIRCAEKTAQG